ncbi:MAG: hypothetical protein AAB444_02170 [Patescibacteria group bacterium]
MIFKRRKEKKYENPFRVEPRRFSRHLWLVPFLALFGVGISLFLFSNFWQIQTVVIGGNYAFEVERVKSILQSHLGNRKAGILPGNHFFLTRRGALEGFLQDEFPLAQVRVVKDWNSRTLRVYGIERPLFGYYISRGLAFHIDRDGRVLSAAFPSPDELARFVRFYGLDGNIPERQTLALAPEALNFFKSVQGAKAKKITGKFWAFSQKGESVEVETGNGYKVVFNYREAADIQLAKLDQVLKGVIKEDISKLDYIDLRFGERVYYKWK